jgi:aldose 1-epimerase
MRIFVRLVLMAMITVATADAAVAQTRYTTKTTGDIVQLRDNTADVTVSVMTSLGSAYEIVVKGHNIIQTSFTSTDQYRAAPGLRGMPLLAPWANRLDEMAFWANGRKYNLDPEIGNVRGPIPLHGFIQGGATWTLVETKADRNAAWVTSRLDFYRQPLYMAQWPFAHTISLTYKISGGVVEVQTKIDNLSNEPMPVAIGFHPSYWLTDSTRDEWTLSVGAKTHWLLAENKVPTGVTEPITNFFPDPKNVSLKDYALDDVFSDLERDADGRATMTVKGKQQQLEVKFGPKYKAAVLWSNRPGPPRGGGPGRGFGGGQGRAAGPASVAPSGPPPPPPASLPLSAKPETVPPDRGYIAFEPMVGITNSMNMTQKGTYKELQTVPPKGTWEESFWIKATGF